MQKTLNPYGHTCVDSGQPCNACDWASRQPLQTFEQWSELNDGNRLEWAREMLESLALAYRELALDARMNVKRAIREAGGQSSQ